MSDRERLDKTAAVAEKTPMGIQSSGADCGEGFGRHGGPAVGLAVSPLCALHTRLQLSDRGLCDFAAAIIHEARRAGARVPSPPLGALKKLVG